MREIKFRCWDTGINFMYYDTDCYNIYNENYNGLHSGYEDKYGTWHQNKLMQYTGLKDKNEKEIYEGDIVTYDLGFDDEKPENYKIIFDNKECAYLMFSLNDKSRLRHFTYSAKNDCEVIGNIYENSELLN